MNLSTIFLLFLISSPSFCQDDLGIGIVKITFNEGTIVDFYNTARDTKPLESIEFTLDPGYNTT